VRINGKLAWRRPRHGLTVAQAACQPSANVIRLGVSRPKASAQKINNQYLIGIPGVASAGIAAGGVINGDISWRGGGVM